MTDVEIPEDAVKRAFAEVRKQLFTQAGGTVRLTDRNIVGPWLDIAQDAVLAIIADRSRRPSDDATKPREALRVYGEWAGYTQIVGVAIRYNGLVCALPRPARHHHVINAIASATGEGVGGQHEQGFVTDTGKFLGRVGARQLATDNGQYRGDGKGQQLFSEDLW